LPYTKWNQYNGIYRESPGCNTYFITGKSNCSKYFDSKISAFSASKTIEDQFFLEEKKGWGFMLLKFFG
jgi:hypothetical protein